MPKNSRAFSAVIPPPIKGINTMDPISNMDPLNAIELENFFPAYGTVDLRNGSLIHCATTFGPIGLSSPLASFSYGSINSMISGDTFGNLLDVSVSPAVQIDGGVSGLRPWLYATQFRDRIFVKASATDVYHWLGTGTGNVVISNFVGPGGDDKLLDRMAVYKNRLYFVGTTSQSVWYGGVDAVTGALTEFSVSSILTNGGNVLFIGTATRSKDANEDLLFVIITSSGEILVYQGDNPGSSTWGILGKYYIPAPISTGNAFFYYGSTLMILTKSGLYGMDSIMGGNFSSPNSGIRTGDVSEPVKSLFNPALADPTDVSKPINGIYYPAGNKIIITFVALTFPSTSYQLVMNTVTGAWTKFTGWGATVFCVFNGDLYFQTTKAAGQTVIMKADIGDYDEDIENPGSALARTIKMRPAYNYFDDRSKEKQFVEAKPIMYQSEGLALTMGADVDYANVAATQVITPDTTDTSYKLYNPRVGLTGIGKCASIRIDGTVYTKRMSLQAIEVIWNDGDI